MPVVPQFYTLRGSRRYQRQRQRRRVVTALLGVGIVALCLGFWALVAPGSGERRVDVESTGAGDIRGESVAVAPREETLDLDRDQPGAELVASNGANADAAEETAPGGGLGSSVAAAAPITHAVMTPPEQAKPRVLRAEAVPPRRAAKAARIQIAAVNSAAAGHRLWRQLRHEHADILGGLDATVQREPSGGRAALYRVEIGPLAAASAKRTCDALQRREIACLVLHSAAG